MGEIKQTNFRLDQETVDAFRDFCEKNGMNQAQGFAHIMQIVEMDRAKMATPGRAVEIEAFEKNIKNITDAYLNSLEICNDAEGRIREQFATSLDSKDKMIAELQTKIASLQTEKDIAEQTATSATKAAAQAAKEAEAAKEQAATAARLVEEKDRTIATLAEKLATIECKANDYDKLKDDLDKERLEKDKLIQAHELEKQKLASNIEIAVAAKEKELMIQMREIEKENARLQARNEMLEAR